MVDLRASNAKLRDRGARIIGMLTGLNRDDATELLKRADGHVKAAIVMHKRNVALDEAGRMLERADGKLRAAIGD
jgi:N-acetylmuramic acid 6-phosphate etherase